MPFGEALLADIVANSVNVSVWELNDCCKTPYLGLVSWNPLQKFFLEKKKEKRKKQKVRSNNITS